MKTSFRVENSNSETVESALHRVYWRQGFTLVPFDPSTIIAGFAITVADEGNDCLVGTRSYVSDLVALLHFVAICSNILIWVFLGFFPFIAGLSFTTAILVGIPYLVNIRNNQIIHEILSDRSFLSKEFEGIRFANRGLVDYLENWVGLVCIPIVLFILSCVINISFTEDDDNIQSLFYPFSETLAIFLADAFVLGFLIVMAMPIFFLIGLIYGYGYYFWTMLTKKEAEE